MSKYNEQPNFWREIDQKEFARIFFHYCFDSPESRQMTHNTDGEKLKKSIMRVRLFHIAYSFWEGLGVAIAEIDGQVKFFKYGNEITWRTKENEFSAQFARDNS